MCFTRSLSSEVGRCTFSCHLFKVPSVFLGTKTLPQITDFFDNLCISLTKPDYHQDWECSVQQHVLKLVVKGCSDAMQHHIGIMIKR